MSVHVGTVRELMRYPVKSMAGVATTAAFLGLHGLQGDRRYALRRIGDNNGFPWLTASKLPELILYAPLGFDNDAEDPRPTHVRTPDGVEFELGSPDLPRYVAQKYGSELELMRFNHGIFDDANVSVINLSTVATICGEAAQPVDPRRFRPNVVIDPVASDPFLEDDWIGSRLVFGNEDSGPAVSVTMRDVRCMMINLDPETAVQDANVLKAVVRLNDNRAGTYGTVVRPGRINVGDTVTLILA